ncbi:MAG TPA: hypothetical protein K8V15_04345 [Tessaracoccus flavescens]|uniref:DUF3298 domain-containing protein n=1 Tax=Tessaracoccus flavescens TaxID=399497 RepID=A0A921EPA8_9ACTN|nr:hypothetical protein [Tessaracoccus flavescens]
MSAKNIKNLILTTTIATLAVGLSACAPGAMQPDMPAASTPSTSTASTPTGASPSPTDTETSTSASPTATEEPTGTEPEVAIHPAPDGLPGAAACYNDEGTPAGEAELGPDIEPGAVQAFFCGDAPTGYGTVGPLEPVVGEHVEQLIAEYNALPELTNNDAQAAANYSRLVFIYPDGDKRIIGFDEQDDTAVSGGPTKKQGSRDYWLSVRNHWVDQRQEIGDDVPVNAVEVVATCPAPEYHLMPHPIVDVDAGWACQGGSEEFKTQVLEPEFIGRIVDVLEEQSQPAADDNRNTEGPTISLMVPWGESLVLNKLEGEDAYLWRGDQSMMVFAPEGELAAEMGEAILATP